jgi:hypothetical protein
VGSGWNVDKLNLIAYRLSPYKSIYSVHPPSGTILPSLESCLGFPDTASQWRQVRHRGTRSLGRLLLAG